MDTPRDVAARPRKKLGALLVEEGVIDPTVLATALRVQQERQPRPRLGTLLLEMRALSEESLTLALARHFGVGYVDLDAKVLDPALAEIVPRSYAAKIHAVPFGVDDDGRVLLAMEDPDDVRSVDDLGMLSGYELAVHAALPSAVRRAVHRLYEGGTVQPIGEVDRAERLWNAVLRDAVNHGARSVRIEPTRAHQVVVRAAVGTGWQELVRGEERTAHHLVDHLFQQARWTARDETTGARRGFVQAHAGAREVTVRLETLPTLRGELLTARLLQAGDDCPALAALELEEGTRRTLTGALRKPAGLVLLAGASRAARQALFAACLRAAVEDGRSAIALEEAPEYALEGVHQIPLAGQPLETWRAVLRQEPAVIAVDAVRDRELAAEVLQAAADGRFAIAALPAVDAAHTLARWLEWGLPVERLGAVLEVAVGVVPVRRLCTECARPDDPPRYAVADLGLDLPTEGTWRAPAGCAACDGSGWAGHVFVADGISGEALRASFADRRRNGGALDPADARIRDPWLDGLRRVAQGLTTVAELCRALPAAARTPDARASV